MSMLETAYTLALTALRPALGVVARGDGKLARGIRGRRGVMGRMAAWSSAERDPDRPLVWFHAASVGEGLQARAVIEAFRGRNPGTQVIHTFFSPSAESLATGMPADFADYLPLDLPGEMGRALDLLRPDVLAFSKGDVWPNLTREAARRGVRLALLSATVPPTSSRLRGPARALLRPAHARLDQAAAIAPADADRLRELGVPPDAVSVMGDAHFDRVLTRADATDRSSDLLRPLVGEPGDVTLVAGSTWPADEERLIAALVSLQRRRPPARLMLVPHEPTPAHLRRTEERLAEHGMRARRLGDLGGRWDGEEVLLVDRVGVLGQLYAVADLAYVGGGWGTAGLHSVLEPAAFGVPIVMGPRHLNAREAAELVAAGGAFAVDSQAALDERLRLLLQDAVIRGAAGAAARAYVEAGRGAAVRGAEIIEELLRGKV
jgi:3-deoxy-D-manno-octulosonic-acid transferase